MHQLSHTQPQDKETTFSGLSQTMAITTEGPWLPMSQHSLVLLLLHGYGNFGASMGSQNTVNLGQRGKGP